MVFTCLLKDTQDFPTEFNSQFGFKVPPCIVALLCLVSSSQSTSSPSDDPNFLQLSPTHMVLSSASETLFMIFLSPKTSFLPFLLSKFQHGHEFEQTLGGSEGQRNLACCSPWGHKELDTAEQQHKQYSNRRFIIEKGRKK